MMGTVGETGGWSDLAGSLEGPGVLRIIPGPSEVQHRGSSGQKYRLPRGGIASPELCYATVGCVYVLWYPRVTSKLA